MDGGYQNLVKEAKKRAVYSAADSFVSRDMVIPEEFVQAYINNPDDTNDMLREKLKDDIRDDMLSKDRDILYKLGMGIDYFSDDEIDTVIDSVLEYDKSDIAGAMAKKHGATNILPRKCLRRRRKEWCIPFCESIGRCRLR